MQTVNSIFYIFIHLFGAIQGCGLRPLLSKQLVGRSGRIIGGRIALDGEWPWQVFLTTIGGRFCGGTLIDHQWVITAAHCVHNQNEVFIRIGANNRSSFREKHRHFVSLSALIIVHPLFSETNYLNDIALLKLNVSVKYTTYIQPVCLPDDSTSFQDQISYLTGWGSDKETNLQGTSKLKVVELPVLDNEFCNLLLTWASINFELSDGQFCAGYINGGEDGCLGDSGSGLVVEENDTWVIAGIMSSGWGCGRPFQPGLYTNVSKYINWIKTNLLEHS